MSHRILIADDEASLRKVLASSLRKEGYDVVSVKSGDEAMEVLEASESPDTGEPFHLVITDLRMPGMDGMVLLQRINKRFRDLPVVVLTAHGTVDLAVQALKQGAFDFITKPYERDELCSVVKKALEHRARDVEEPQGDDERTLVGASERMRKVDEIIAKVADSPSTVLITGESGTGKELVALALHNKSSRHDKPFIRINAAAIPPTLIEAELFGHEKGAFTGAVSSKPGRFELAHGGTLFLDEIGELPIDMQVKLLRVLQESTFERVGGIKTLQVDVRLIAATNRDLRKAIDQGQFREDLFWRLNVVPVELPPLRERTEDVPVLVEAFIKKLNRRLNRSVERFTPEAIAVLQSYPWPGNIRELENIVERTLLFADKSVIDAGELPPDLQAKIGGLAPRATAVATAEPIGEGSMKDIVKQRMAELEKDLIQRALDDTQGNVTHAARKLKISRKSLQIKMKELGLREESKVPEEPTAKDG
ncbi:MAG: sigma-54-dependent Fis family transcriptional regulator [Deltaproteobacteria bacterium]|nr:sigma-54-dependent Fis family transcriptional regulator [Deltaproteobacteria bacterium]